MRELDEPAGTGGGEGALTMWLELTGLGGAGGAAGTPAGWGRG